MEGFSRRLLPNGGVSPKQSEPSHESQDGTVSSSVKQSHHHHLKLSRLMKVKTEQSHQMLIWVSSSHHLMRMFREGGELRGIAIANSLIIW